MHHLAVFSVKAFPGLPRISKCTYIKCISINKKETFIKKMMKNISIFVHLSTVAIYIEQIIYLVLSVIMIKTYYLT